MLNPVIDAIGAVCAAIRVWCSSRSYLCKSDDKTEAAQIALDDYKQKFTQATGISAYETLCMSAEERHVSL